MRQKPRSTFAGPTRGDRRRLLAAIRGAALCVLLGLATPLIDAAPAEQEPGVPVTRGGAPGDAGRDASRAAAIVEDLGNPTFDRWPDKPYARNVWDMATHDGRVYLGSGNSSNIGPSPNAGPAPIMAFVPAEGRFVQEFLTDDEQVDRFRSAGGLLWVPGHDSKEPWRFGNLYRRGLNRWEKVRTVPGGIHVYDLLFHDRRLWAALGAKRSRVLASSPDYGASWQAYELALPGQLRGPPRAYHLFVLHGRLYAVTAPGLSVPAAGVGRVTPVAGTNVHRWNGVRFEAVSPSFLASVGPELLPGAGDSWRTQLKTRFEAQLGAALYLLLGRSWNDHQFLPLALVQVHTDQYATPVSLGPGELPWDLWSDGDTLLVLCNRELANGSVRISVRMQRAGETELREIVAFEDETFARSFTVFDGDLYFGLGTEVREPWRYGVHARISPEERRAVRLQWRAELSARSGQILRVRGRQLAAPVAG